MRRSRWEPRRPTAAPLPDAQERLREPLYHYRHATGQGTRSKCTGVTVGFGRLHWHLPGVRALVPECQLAVLRRPSGKANNSKPEQYLQVRTSATLVTLVVSRALYRYTGIGLCSQHAPRMLKGVEQLADAAGSRQWETADAVCLLDEISGDVTVAHGSNDKDDGATRRDKRRQLERV